MKNVNKDVYRYLVIFVGLLVIAGALFLKTYGVHEKYNNVEEYSNYLSENYQTVLYSAELEKMFDEKYIKGDTLIGNQFVDYLLTRISADREVFTAKITMMTPIFKNENLTLESINDNPSIIKNKSARLFIEEDLILNHLKLIEVGGYYEIEPNYEYIYKTYGDYITEDLKDVLVYLSQNDFVELNDGDSFNIPYLIERIDTAQKLIDKHIDSKFDYTINILDNQIFYYELLFGGNHTYFINSELEYNNSYILNLEAIASGDTQIAKDTFELLKVIEINKMKETANVTIWIDDFIANKKNIIDVYDESE